MAKITSLHPQRPAAAAAPQPAAKPKPPAVRTGQGLRDVLFDEIDALRAGVGDRRRAMAISALAAQIINTAKAEIEYQRMLAREGENNRANVPQLGTLQLGSDGETPKG